MKPAREHAHSTLLNSYTFANPAVTGGIFLFLNRLKAWVRLLFISRRFRRNTQNWNALLCGNLRVQQENYVRYIGIGNHLLENI